ncbi:hypothetical protein [Cobetia sp. 5-25-4-2]|uniref:hypothetical protein n=1 Tax=Cobetia sp. 5-25-4-2 TaxID=2737459 RepID=UPI0021004322|nr:hypothetical protein [Cobetia sp. 5-25-4-2]
MLAMHAAIQRGAGTGLAWDFMAGDAIAKGELVRVTDHRAIIGLAEHLAHGPHRPLPASARLFRDWLIARVGNIKSVDGGY